MAGMADHAMSGAMTENMMKHMELTPTRPPTHADSVRAMALAGEIKHAIAKYEDTSAAVADGYKMFLPNVKTQHVYHFTNGRHAIGEAFRFDATKPTSILYKRSSDGTLRLVGAMYTMPKNARLSRLDDRVPLSIARWHKHVNWCLPKEGQAARWLEQKNGAPVFGPESPIATKAGCDAVRGDFHPHLFGWMLHANVDEGKIVGTKAVAGISPNAGVFKLDIEKFSRDPNVVAECRAEPMVYTEGAPAHTAKELLNAIASIDERMDDVFVPILLLHGEDDEVTDPNGSKSMYERTRSSDRTLRIYPKLVHDLVHEPEKGKVITDINEWTVTHVKALEERAAAAQAKKQPSRSNEG